MNTNKFTYGVATSSFQIEGAADSRLASIWDTFCDTEGKINDNSNGLVACEHVKRWQEDVELIDSLGVDAYRFSVSWPRVITQDGELNPEGVDFYIQLLDKLNALDIKAYVTLYHWDLPQYLEDNGGWLNRETAYKFSDYADKISKAFGDRVYAYATLNEPWCSAFLGYETGDHAPGKNSKKAGRQAAHHLLLAHGLAIQVLNKNCPNVQKGIVLNFSPCHAKTNSDGDKAAAKFADDYFNQWYIQPLIDGKYPELLHQFPQQEQPDIVDGDMEIIAQPLDFLGINYYSRSIFAASTEHDFAWVSPDGTYPTTQMGWEIYPQGFTEILCDLNTRYQLPPIIITENGAAMKDELEGGKVDDTDRIDFFQKHLLAVDEAINQGVDIQGYFAWSLMDNFEWAHGYEKRFGIVHVDYQTQVRTIKASGFAFRDFVSQRDSTS